jgi:hypothetical protein
MAKQNLTSDRIDLPDGRTVHVLTYPDRSVRIRLTGGAPYAITEAYLARGQHDHVTVKLTPLGEVTTADR